MEAIIILALLCVGAWLSIRERKKKKDIAKLALEEESKKRQQQNLSASAAISALGCPSYNYDEGKTRVEIFDDKKILVINLRQIRFSDIIGAELIIHHYSYNEHDKVTTTNGKHLGSTIGRAAVGVAVGGIVGGVVGAITSKGGSTSIIEKGKSYKWDEYAIIIKVANGEDGFFETRDSAPANKIISLAKAITGKDAVIKEIDA